MLHYLEMGGYAAFVWPAYAVSFAGIGAIIWVTLKDYTRAQSRLKQLEADDQA